MMAIICFLFAIFHVGVCVVNVNTKNYGVAVGNGLTSIIMGMLSTSLLIVSSLNTHLGG
jgi:heme/copper-type cytochrome/quinol oxidase subunit 3